MPVKSIEHTADLRVRAVGRSFQGTLLELSNHMLRMVYGTFTGTDFHFESLVECSSDESCVVRLLNDLIYTAESRGLAIRVRRITVCDSGISWEGLGESLGKGERGSILVKAATYDRLVVRRKPPLIEITFDI